MSGLHKAAGGAEAYAKQICATHANMFAIGFQPEYLFRCTSDSAAFMLGEMYQALCFSGVYPRNLYVTFSKQAGHTADLYCELYHPDWNSYLSLSLEAFTNPANQIFDPLRVGMADKVRAILRSGQEPPVIRFCPFQRGTIIFGADGHVGMCPVALGQGSQGSTARTQTLVGDYHAGTTFKEAQERWELRGLSSIPECSGCRVAPLCGSGCPLEALEATGDLYSPACPPVESILEQEISIARKRNNDL